MGRPTKYNREMCAAVARSVPGGATWPAIAQECGVDRATVIVWDAKHPEFHDAVKAAKDAVDETVELAMLDAARGRRRIDTTAALFWLCNRRPDRWRHVQRVEHSGPEGGAITITDLVRAAARK